MNLRKLRRHRPRLPNAIQKTPDFCALQRRLLSKHQDPFSDVIAKGKEHKGDSVLGPQASSPARVERNHVADQGCAGRGQARTPAAPGTSHRIRFPEALRYRVLIPESLSPDRTLPVLCSE